MDINRLKEFYTGLYHTMLGPVLLSDSDGTYRFGSGNFQDDASKEKFIKHIGTEAFSTFSLWDTFRGVQPLMNLLHPQKSTIAVYFAGRAANTASIFSHSPFDYFLSTDGSEIEYVYLRSKVIKKLVYFTLVF